MPATPAEIHAIDYRHLFPWVRLFRAFRIAADVRKLLLAALALLCLAGGEWLFARLPFAPEDGQARSSSAQWTAQQNLDRRAQNSWTMYPLLRTDLPGETVAAAGVGALVDFLSDPAGTLGTALGNWRTVLRPFRTIVDPALSLLDREKTWADAAWGWTRLLWALVVWAIFGGAITRMAAVEFARDERIGLLSAVRYSASRFVSYLAAPLLPILALLGLWMLCALGALVGRIPGIGDSLVGLFWFVPLLIALLMMLLVLGTAAGWPLMYATISVEGSDGFDGFSRSYSYVFSRPWRYLWYAVLAMLYGSLLIFFVGLAASLIVYLAAWSVGSGMGAERVAALHAGTPASLSGTPLAEPPLPIDAGPFRGFADSAPATGGVSGFARGAVTFWLSVLSLLLHGFVYSYFWTAWTILYFLLRRADDATETDEVYLPDEPARDELLPLVGAAASEHPMIERPVRPENPQAAGPT